MGVVYRAHDERLQRDVAVKVLSPGVLTDDAARERFRTEALTLSRVNHPNVATLHDFDTCDGVDFLVTEFIEGTSLADRLALRPLTEVEVLRFGLQMAEGLAAAHQQGIVHGDVKPANLFITGDNRLKVLDFGLAIAAEHRGADATATRTQTGAVKGTLPYMAPEQLRGERATACSDTWAAGATLYEMATGRRPFVETAPAALAAEILRASLPTPRQLQPALSQRLEDVILKALAKDPEHRYQSAAELAVDLRRLTSAAPDPMALSVPPPRRHLRPVLIGAVVLAASATISIALFARRDGAGTALPPITSVAVLPLDNLSGNPAEEYFADGMTEALIAELARVRAMNVISRTSVMRYKGARKSLPDVAAELGVNGIVEGSVMRVGDRVRITAQLIDARTDRHLWAQNYERSISDVLALQREVALAIAEEIKVTVTPQERAKLSTARPIDPQAQEAYLRGRHLLERWSLATTTQAREFFQQAIARDPDYALPYIGIAEAYLWGSPGVTDPERLSRTREAATRALQIDNGLGEPHAMLATIQWEELQFAAAEASYRRALELSPNSGPAHHLYAHFLVNLGRHVEAMVHAQRFLAIDPVSPAANLHLGYHHLVTAEYDPAIAQLQKTLQMDPAYIEAHKYLGQAYLGKGMLDHAIASLDRARELSQDNVYYRSLLGHAYGVAGRRKEARAMLDALLNVRNADAWTQSAIARIYAGLGDKDRAFQWLETVSQIAPALLIVLPEQVEFNTLRSDPRYGALLRRLNVPGI